MRAVVLAGTVGFMAAVATPAIADWEYRPYSDGGGKAVVTVDGASLVVSCRPEGGLVAYYEFPKSDLAKQLEGLEQAYAHFQLDPDASGSGKTFSFRNKLHDWEETMGIGAAGRGADDLANWFSKARRKIGAGLMPGKRSSEYVVYVAKDFPAAGSTNAIRQVKKDCPPASRP